LADSAPFSPNERNANEQRQRKKLLNAQIKRDAANQVKPGEIPSSPVRDKCFDFFKARNQISAFHRTRFGFDFDLAPPSIAFSFLSTRPFKLEMIEVF
jgi:hypothetical protein